MQDLRSTRKALAVAQTDAEPSFDHVAGVASAAILCDMSVQVLCLTDDQLQRWRRRFKRTPDAPTNIHIHNLNRSTLAEWQAVIGRRHPDMTVLAGFHSARRRQEISAEYADALIDAVPAGFVVMA